MDHIGIDVHKKDSQICILTEHGKLLERRVRTEPRRFAEELGTRPRARILIESSTESEWVARCIEALGHEVIVADPNFAPMYAQRSRGLLDLRCGSRRSRRRDHGRAVPCLFSAPHAAHCTARHGVCSHAAPPPIEWAMFTYSSDRLTAGPGVEPCTERPEGTVVGRSREPGEAECCSQELATLVEHAAILH